MASRSRQIVVLTPHFTPETGAAARRLAALADALRDEGWRVVVITLLPHHPGNRVHAGYGPGAERSDDEGDKTVVRLRPWIVPRETLVLRLLSELVFVTQAAAIATLRKPDVIFASSPSMFLGPLGLIAARLARAEFAWDVRDLTWLYPRAAGKRTFGLDRVLERIMRATAARCNALVTATFGLRTYFDRRPHLSMVHVNGVTETWRATLAALPPPDPTKGRVLYAGLLGYNHGLSTLIEAAALLPEKNFRIVGDGPERPALEALVRERGLENVTFVGFASGEQLIDEYRRASVLVSHVRDHPLHRWTQPAKLWEYMATGRPVVHAGEGEAVDLLRSRSIAWTSKPESPIDLANTILRTFIDWSASMAMAQRAREYVATSRTREVLLREVTTMLDVLRSD